MPRWTRKTINSNTYFERKLSYQILQRFSYEWDKYKNFFLTNVCLEHFMAFHNSKNHLSTRFCQLKNCHPLKIC